MERRSLRRDEAPGVPEHPDAAAESDVVGLIYADLRRLAARHFRQERRDHTLQVTALVNEAYLRLTRQIDATCAGREHYLALAARAMRQILVDHARRHRSGKRWGAQQRIGFEDLAVRGGESSGVLALDEALERLAKWDERASRVVELRFFGGFKEEEIAAILGVNVRTVKRDWVAARAWLRGELKA